MLAALGVVGSYYNALSIVAQCQAEGGEAKFNPLNTTLVFNGSTPYNTLPGGMAVQNYRSYADGIQATVQTLRQENMSGLYAALKVGNASMVYWKALAVSPWGTIPPGGLTIGQWLDDCRRHWYQYSMVPIPGT